MSPTSAFLFVGVPKRTLRFGRVETTEPFYPARRPARSCKRLQGSLTVRMSGKVWLLTCFSSCFPPILVSEWRAYV
jgi:hypothetical protein